MRHPTGDFFICDIFDASPKDDLGSMEHPIFSLSTRPDRRILSYAHNGTHIEVTPSVRGRATMHDKDILIFCISQIMAAMNAGRAVSRTLQLRAHDLLVATNRDTSGDAYARLREAFERLAVTLSEWIWRAVMAKSVLTLSRDYFRLRKPLERRIYELARKHCGRQPEWRVSVATLHKKAGSAAPVRVFRAALRKMIQDGHLPDYRMDEAAGDLMVFTRASAVIDDVAAPVLRADTLDQARGLRPGADVYALEAEWRSWWDATGRTRLGSPDAAFLGWLRKKPQG